MTIKKVALITGASSGIGKELSHIHAEKGGDLIIVARNLSKLEVLKSEIEKKHATQVHIIAKDLSLPNSPKEIYDELKNKEISVDYLINNAGFGGHGKFHEREWKQDQAMINLNIMALTALTRFFLPEMVSKNAGKILNVSSTASLMPGPLQAVYFATKAYVTFFSNAIAEELHDTDVTVTALLPGATETEFAQTAGIDQTDLFKDAVDARSVAEDGYNGMLAGKLDVISGLTLSQKMMAAMIPIAPKRMMLKQMRQMQEIKKS